MARRSEPLSAGAPSAVRVPASTSNIGAGFDCLGLALDLWLEAEIREGDGPDLYEGELARVDRHKEVIALILGTRAIEGRHLVVRSSIPVGRGLGSSAAARVAAYALLGFNRNAVFADAAESEGHPDNVAAAVYGGLVLVAHRPVKLEFNAQLGVALAIPSHSIPTEAARGMLPSQVDRNTAVQQAARSAALIAGLATADPELVGFGMDDRIAVPVRKTLIPGFDDAVRAGQKAGAFGVTISGAGSALLAIGPVEIASSIAQAMARAIGPETKALAPAVASEGLELIL